MTRQDGALAATPRAPALQAARDELRALDQEGSGAENVARHEKLLQHGDAPVEVSYRLGLLYQASGRFHEALARFEACCASPEYIAAALVGRGECELALDHAERASEFFDQALAYSPLADAPSSADVERVLRLALDSAERQGDAERGAAYRSLLAQVDAEDASATVPVVDAAVADDATQRLAPKGAEQLESLPSTGRLATLAEVHGSPALPVGPGTGRLHSSYRRVLTSSESATEGKEAPAQPVLVATRWQARAGGTSSSRFPAGFRRGAVPLPRVTPLPSTVQPSDVARPLLERAASDLQEGHSAAAIQSCQEALVAEPEYILTHLRLAEAYAVYGHLSEALATCQVLIRLYETRRDSAGTIPVYRLIGAITPDDLTAWTTMADHYFAQGGDPRIRDDVAAFIQRAAGMGRPDVALEYAERLASSARDDASVQRLAGELQLRLGEPTRALPHYQVLLRQDPSDMVAVAGANIALTLRDGTVHWPSLERLVQYLPSFGEDTARLVLDLYAQSTGRAVSGAAELHCCSGVLTLTLHDTTAAKTHFLLAQEGATPRTDRRVQFAMAFGMRLTMSALDAGVVEREWILRALALLEDSRVHEFAAQSTIFGEPVTATTLQIALAESYLLDGHDREAVAVLERAKHEFPDDAAVPRRLAALFTLQGNIGQALDELDELSRRQLQMGQLPGMLETLGQMSALAGDNIAVKNRLVGLYSARGFPRQALRELDRIATIHERAGRPSGAAEALRQSAELAEMIGDRQDATGRYERALALAPHNLGLLQGYINTLLREGRRADAVGHQRTIARTHLAQQEVPAAIAALHQVLVLDPHDIDGHFQLGELLSSAGEYAEAERVYRRLLRLRPDDPLAQEKQLAMAELAKG